MLKNKISAVLIFAILLFFKAPLPVFASYGDGNNDGFVDGKDFVIWLIHFGQNVSGLSNGDYDENNKVEVEDYVVWINTYNTQSSPTPTNTPSPGATLQFKSGFESNTYIGSKTIKGIDNSSQSGINNWDNLPNYLQWAKFPYYYFEGGSLEITNDPTNTNNQVLHTHNKSVVGGISRTQWTMSQVEKWSDPGGPNLFDKQFYRYRMYIPKEIETLYSYSEPAKWYMIWESHAWVSEDTRHGAYIKKDANSDHWYFQVVQERPEGYWNVIWENLDTQNVTVPFGEWFTFDVFFKYHETDGEFFIAITREGGPRQVTAHYKGKTKFDTKLRDQMVFKHYHDDDYILRLPGGTHHYYDDFEIWSDYPPGY